MRCRPTNAQRCTVAGWMRQTAEETIAKLDAVMRSSQQPPESRCLALAHQDIYRKVLDVSLREQKQWCNRG